MDISSTSSTVNSTSNNTTTNTTSTASKAADSDNSFKSEMNKVSSETKSSEKDVVNNSSDELTQKEEKSGEDIQKNDPHKIPDSKITNKIIENINLENGNYDANILLSGEIDFNNMQNIREISQNDLVSVQNVLLDANKQLADIAIMTEFPAKVSYTNIEMTYDDATFFADLVQNTDKTLQSVVTDIQSNTISKKTAQHVKVSATLMTALSEAVKNNQSFRIDFDKDISVIIKVDRDGSLSARFIPGDNAVEQYLKQNISILRQRFDEQELSYNELTYTKQQRNKQQERRNNKENN